MRPKLLIMTNRKLHIMRLRLAPRSMTLDDHVRKFEFSENFAGRLSDLWTMEPADYRAEVSSNRPTVLLTVRSVCVGVRSTIRLNDEYLATVADGHLHRYQWYSPCDVTR